MVQSFCKLFRKFFLTTFFPFMLTGFEPKIVTPYPVLGFREHVFFDPHQKVERRLLMWYPVMPGTMGKPSNNAWDIFNVASNAPLDPSQANQRLIVLSHGYIGSPQNQSWLIRELVHQGFMVAAIPHRDLMDGIFHLNHWQRAQDITTLLDQFADLPLAKNIDLNKVGIAGFSLGGTTAMWVAGGKTTRLDSLVPGPEYAAPRDYTRTNEALPTLNKEMMSKDWRDKRVQAAFVMAPGWSWLFDPASLQQISIPVYLIAAEADQTLVTKNNAGLFARYIPKAFFQTISGKAGHFIFISALSTEHRQAVDPKGQLQFLFEDDPSVDRTWIQSQISEEAVRFFKSTLLDNPCD